MIASRRSTGLASALARPYGRRNGKQKKTRMMEMIAHRGASYDAPENTLAAFRLAWSQGADAWS